MNRLAIPTAVVALFGLRAAMAFEGCFIGNQPYAAIHRLADGTPDPRPIIDFYFDDEFTTSAELNGLSAADAEELVKQVLVGLQSEAGAPLFFRFAGYSPPAPSYQGRPQIVFSAVDDPVDCGSLDAVACAQPSAPSPEMLWGKVWLIRNGADLRDLFRGTVAHEVLHTLRLEHPYDPSCALQWRDDESVLGTPWYSGLTMGDKRNLRTAYGYSEQSVRRRQSQPFGTWGWSAPTSLTEEVVLSPPRASNGRSRNHGVAYAVRAWGDSGRPYVRIYEDPVWLAPEAVTGWSTYHSPDLAWGTYGGESRWAVAILANDYREALGPDLVVAERTEGSTTWSQSARLDLNLKTPWVAVTHDPMSGRWIVAYLTLQDEVTVRALTPGSLTWHTPVVVGAGWRFYRGVDIACSERHNSTTGANCLVSGIGTPDLPDGPGRGTGGVTNIWFRLSGTTPVVVATSSAFPLRADVPPQLVANPIAGANPQFLLGYTRSVTLDDWRKLHFRSLSENDVFWGGWLSTYTAGSADRQYLPFSPGTHVFGGTAYNDLHYSLDF
ncbi:MAG: hypothetical protein R3F60_05245 [bacterium]